MTGGAGGLVLVLSIGLQCSRRLGTAACLCALQALVAAVLLMEAGTAAAMLALVFNGLVMPLAMTRLAGDSLLTPRIGAIAGWTAMSGVLVATVALFAGLGADGRVTVGVVVVLLGLMLVASRSHALSPALGLLSAQNGLILVASANPTSSLQATLLVAVPLVPALASAGFWLRQ